MTYQRRTPQQYMVKAIAATGERLQREIRSLTATEATQKAEGIWEKEGRTEIVYVSAKNLAKPTDQYIDDRRPIEARRQPRLWT